jgi:Bacterial Ig domain
VVRYADAYWTPDDGALTVPAPGFFANDTNTCGGDHLVHEGPSHGALTLDGDGGFAYQRDAGFSGIDKFTYAIATGVDEGNWRSGSRPGVLVAVHGIGTVSIFVGEREDPALEDSFTASVTRG